MTQNKQGCLPCSVGTLRVSRGEGVFLECSAVQQARGQILGSDLKGSPPPPKQPCLLVSFPTVSPAEDQEALGLLKAQPDMFLQQYWPLQRHCLLPSLQTTDSDTNSYLPSDESTRGVGRDE